MGGVEDVRLSSRIANGHPQSQYQWTPDCPSEYHCGGQHQDGQQYASMANSGLVLAPQRHPQEDMEVDMTPTGGLGMEVARAP